MSKYNDPILTFRIALEATDRGAAVEIARRIVALGLEATSVTGRGVLAAGARSAIEKALHTRIDLTRDIPHFAVEPHIEGLECDTPYRMYFPREPTYF
jgi:hypothetical protein